MNNPYPDNSTNSRERHVTKKKIIIERQRIKDGELIVDKEDRDERVELRAKLVQKKDIAIS